MTEPGGAAWRQTTFFPFAITSRLAQGEALELKLDARRYDHRRLRRGPARRRRRDARRRDRRTAVFLVNRSQTEAVTVTVDIATLGDVSVLEAHTLSDDDVYAKNTLEEPERVAPRANDSRAHRRRRNSRSRCLRCRGRRSRSHDPGCGAAIVHGGAPHSAPARRPRPSSRAARALAVACAARLRPPERGSSRATSSTHDPAIARDGDTWFVYSTGNQTVADGNIQVRIRPTARTGATQARSGTRSPTWLKEAVPGVANLWAPELIEHDGTWYLYYSASTFGKNTSVIALATNTTLDPDDPDYEWDDRGLVVASTSRGRLQRDRPRRDRGRRRHAVDGLRVVLERHPHGRARLVGRARADDAEPLRIADRQSPPNAIEAPYIVEHDGDYFLFVSRDACCQGVKSTYNDPRRPRLRGHRSVRRPGRRAAPAGRRNPRARHGGASDRTGRPVGRGRHAGTALLRRGPRRRLPVRDDPVAMGCGRLAECALVTRRSRSVRSLSPSEGDAPSRQSGYRPPRTPHPLRQAQRTDFRPLSLSKGTPLREDCTMTNTGTNWAGNLAYAAERLIAPTSFGELAGALTEANSARILGTRHSFNDIADTNGVLISTASLPVELAIDADARSVRVSGGMRYGDVSRELEAAGWALSNLASLPHISIAGAVATGDSRLGRRGRFACRLRSALEFMTANGELVRLGRGDAGFDGAVVSLGALGVVTTVELDIEPSFRIAQTVYEGLAWDDVLADLDDRAPGSATARACSRRGARRIASTSSGSSNVADPGLGPGDLARCPRRQRTSPPASAAAGSRPRTAPSSWAARRLATTGSRTSSSASPVERGAELQSEYLVPAGAAAAAAIAAVRALAERITPLVHRAPRSAPSPRTTSG